ncbi:MAG TPA: AI-2E family transporter [Edaphobacter sp.]|nr:AI-2E family transporter [Edaphobacter sp.]
MSLTETAQLLRIITGVVVVAALYLGRSVFIPLALALLLALLLGPVMTFLCKLRLPRIVAIAIVGIALGSVAFGFGWKMSAEFTDLADKLPVYKMTLEQKIHALSGLRSRSLSKVSQTVDDLETELVKSSSGTAEEAPTKRPPAPGSSPARPMAVKLVPSSNPLDSIGSVLGVMGSAGMVVIFTIFVLLGREDLRNRFIHLSGGGRLKVMTQALDEATSRVQRYLFLQSAVNAIFGVIVGVGLYLIGIPDAWLWGLVAAVLRFLPYVGAPAAAAVPILLSLAIFPGWGHALGTMAFFFSLEVIVANFVEPFLYGTQVGLSTLAILIAAVFWTLIWGFPGLILSTPLTVSLVVMGRYVPSLNFLKVLLGDEPEISRSDLYYQRLLASDQNEARQVLEQYLEGKSLGELYSEVLIPALGLIEQDRHRNELDEATLNFIMQSTRESIEEIGDLNGVSASAGESVVSNGRASSVVCLPARDEADELVGLLLSQLLQNDHIECHSVSVGTSSEMMSAISALNPDVVCISALPPFAIEYARNLYLKVRAQFPDVDIVVCLWAYGGDLDKMHRRLKIADGHRVLVTMPDVIEHVRNRLRPEIQAVSVSVDAV